MTSMKSFYPNNKWEKEIATNIYDLNGLYVNNYRCNKNGNTYDVEFDVYNSRYYSGAVDIYDSDGVWIGYEEIKKYSDITSIWDTAEQAFYLISDPINKKLLTYEQASFSEHTHIIVSVPEGGYFTISNNVGESPGTYFSNAIEILYSGASTALDAFLSDSVKTSAFSGFRNGVKDSLTKRLLDTHNEVLKKEVKKKTQKIMLSTLKSEVRKISKKITNAEFKDKVSATKEAYSDISGLGENILTAYDISWKHLFQSATGVGESAFEEFAGPAGVALKGCFAITKSSNKLLMGIQMASSCDYAYATICSSMDGEYINPYGVYVTTNGNTNSESKLQVFRVSNSDAVEVLLDSNNPLEKYEIYNICFVKDDKLVQPNGKVKVYIPIPEGMKGSTCKVYRQESDNEWTILDAYIEENYLVFETNHFSLYAVVGEEDNLEIMKLPNKLSYYEGETLNTEGMVIKIGEDEFTEGYVCEPSVLSQVGKQTITVKCGLVESKFDVIVNRVSNNNSEMTTNSGDTSSNAGIKTKDLQKDNSSTIKNVKPKKSSVNKIVSKKKALKVTWKKVKGVSGYKVQYSLKKNFKNAKTKKIKKSSIISITLKKLKSKKKYYVRIRTYKKLDGKIYQSDWSKAKKKKTK